MRHTLISIAILFFWYLSLFGQSCEQEQRYGWIIPVRYQKPFVAEMESYLSRVEEGFGKAEEEYTPYENNSRTYAPYLNVTLGIAIPVWCTKFDNGWSIGVDIPISFHLWLDLQTLSAPVINTDYRFTVGQIKALKIFDEDSKWRRYHIRNLSMRLAPLNHESTHIGDELTIRRKNEGYPLTRVNVAYEYTEFALCINDANGTRMENHAFKAGIMLRMPFSKNWFKIYRADGDVAFNQRMRGITEYYFQYEWQKPMKIFSFLDSDFLLSAELRNRARYTYPTIKWNEETGNWYGQDTKRRRAWCLNLYSGIKFFPKYDWMPQSIGAYLHAYYGIVPYGQFRNTGDYSYLGFSLVVEH